MLILTEDLQPVDTEDARGRLLAERPEVAFVQGINQPLGPQIRVPSQDGVQGVPTPDPVVLPVSNPGTKV